MNTVPEYSNPSISMVVAPKLGRGVTARLVKCSVPAAIITTGLFLGMQALVQAEGFEAPDIEPRVLASFTVDFDEPPEPFRDLRVIRLPDAVTPPPAPAPMKPGDALDFDPIHLTGRAPGAAEIGRMEPISFPSSALRDRDARPIRQPILTYPIKAAERGIEGTCEVRMDVTPQGRPYNVVATCTNGLFVSEAERAVSRVEFLPKLSNGEAMARKNVIYPLEFKLAQ